MHKGQFLKDLAKRTNTTTKAATHFVDNFMAAVVDALAHGGKLILTGFGSFHVRERKARTGRHPRTGAKMHIPAKKTTVFKPGVSLRHAAEGKKHAAPKKKHVAKAAAHGAAKGKAPAGKAPAGKITPAKHAAPAAKHKAAPAKAKKK